MTPTAPMTTTTTTTSSATASSTATQAASGGGTAPGEIRRPHPLRTVAGLTAVELRLVTREPMVLVGLLGLPVVVMVIIAGVFGQNPDPDFGGVAPDDYYIASYLGVVLASLGLITLPVHIATNRELGITRRYRASGIGTGTIVATQIALGVVLAVAASTIVLTVGHLVYGISAPDDLGGAAAWYVLGLVCHLAIGGALGLAVRTSRAANALGNLVFLPTFLLAGGGPPRDVMTDAMQTVSDVIPLSHVTAGLRREWLGATDGAPSVWWPVLVTAAALALAAWVTRRHAD